MARRSLKPQLNQIRAWVREGRTDAWIAHQLEVSATELREFRKQHDLTPDDEEPGTGEVDLRDEIEAEVEAATADETEDDEEAEEEDGQDEEDSEEDASGEGGKRGGGRGGRSSGGRRGERGGRKEEDPKDSEGDDAEAKGSGGEGGSGEGEGGGGQRRRRRRRGRRGGRGRRREIEASFDHGERDGYGLWLDASVKDNPVYSEHWAGKREVTVRIEADQIVIRRAGGDENGEDGEPSDE